MFETDWKEFLETQKLSEVTIKEYTRYLNTINFDKVEARSLNNWIYRHNNRVARAFIKKLIEFLIKFEYVSGREARELEAYRLPKIKGRVAKKEIRTLKKYQVEELADSFKSRMIRLMVLTTFYLGLRRQELLGLRFKDILDDGSVIIRHAKGKKERILIMADQLQDEFTDYFNKLPGETLDKFILANLKIFPISKTSWSVKLGDQSEKLFKFRIKPHELRHSCGSYLKEKGLDLKEIAEFLGHANIISTQIYVHLDKKKLERKIKNAFDE